MSSNHIELPLPTVELESNGSAPNNTEISQLRAQLAAANARIDKLYHAAPVGYVSVDRSGTVVAINQKCLKLLATTESDIIGQSFAQYVSENSRDKFANFLTNQFSSLPNKQRKGSEIVLVSSSKLGVYTSISGTIETTEDGDKLCQLIIVDIEASHHLKETQRLLQASIEHSRDFISISDMRQPDNPVVYASPNIVAMTGYTIEELVGNNWRIFYKGKPDKKAQGVMRRALEEGTECQTIVRNIRKDGTVFPCEVVLYPIRNPQGEVTHFVNIMRDVTERLKSDEKLRQLTRLDSVGTLAGGIAHDFNNLLAAITNQTVLASRKIEQDHVAQKHISQIQDATKDGASLARQLLAYAGRGSFKADWLDLNTVTSKTLNLVNSSAPTDIAFDAQLSDALLLLRADSSQIQQIIMNLIINAWQAIDGTGSVTIKTSRRVVEHGDELSEFVLSDIGEARHYACLEVTDTGCGMDAATLEHILDPFFSTKVSGHGLGLAAVAGVIRSHSGALAVDSEVGVGTTFTVLLPLAVATQGIADEASDTSVDDILPSNGGASNGALVMDSAESPTPLPQHTPAQPVDQTTFTGAAYGPVLVIDDENAVRQSYIDLLEDLGCTTLDANNGRDGLELFELHQEEISLVIIDMYMPIMNGEKTFRALRELAPNTRCLLVSGYSEQETRETLAQFGNVEFLQKPFDVDHFLSTVVRLMTA